MGRGSSLTIDNKQQQQREDESPKRPRRLVNDYEYVEKNKEIAQIRGEIDIILQVSIIGADGIDDLSRYKNVTNRYYRVIGQVEGGQPFCTPIVQGDPDPKWEAKLPLKLDSLLMSRYVRFEVVRFCSESDPGTSTGEILVGRTEIPIPTQFGKVTGGRYGLLRPTEEGYKPEGHIGVTMKKFAAWRRKHSLYY